MIANGPQSSSNILSTEITNRLFDAIKKGDINLLEELIVDKKKANVRLVLSGPLVVDILQGHPTALHLAAFFGNIDSFRFFLNSGTDITKNDCYRRSVLHFACYNGNSEVISTVNEYSTNYSIEDKAGRNAIHYAAEGGNLEAIQLMYSLGAPFDKPDLFGFTPLIFAAQNGHFECVQFLSSLGAATDLIVENRSLLCFACEGPSLECVKFFAEKGLNIEHQSDEGTPLLIAAKRGNFPIVSYLLLEKKAKLNVFDPRGYSPLTLVSSIHSADCVKLLIENGMNPNGMGPKGELPLVDAVAAGDFDLVQFLYDHGADNKFVRTNLLELALIQGNHIDIARFLLQKGAKTNFFVEGAPLAIALVKQQKLDFLKLILSHSGKDILMQLDDHGRTAFHLAARLGNVEIMEFYIKDVGTDVDLLDSKHWTPLHHAVVGKQLKAVQYLFQNGANLNFDDIDGQTPIFSSVIVGSLEMTEFLITKGAVANVVDRSKHTPLYFVSKELNKPLYLLLKQNGCRSKTAIEPPPGSHFLDPPPASVNGTIK